MVKYGRTMVKWRCQKPGCNWETEGTGPGSGRALTHAKMGWRADGEPHPIFLVDENNQPIQDELGNPIASLKKAKRLGHVPLVPSLPSLPSDNPNGKSLNGRDGKPPDGSKDGREKPKTTISVAMKGRLTPIEVPLDARLQFLYEWDRIMLPGYEGSFSDWIWSCVLGFHIQNRETLKLNLIFQEVG